MIMRRGAESDGNSVFDVGPIVVVGAKWNCLDVSGDIGVVGVEQPDRDDWSSRRLMLVGVEAVAGEFSTHCSVLVSTTRVSPQTMRPSASVWNSGIVSWHGGVYAPVCAVESVRAVFCSYEWENLGI